MNNNKLKYNIKTNQNNKENILDLQLFSSVSNPYIFSLDSNYNVSATIESNLVDLSSYAELNIPNYDTITEIPQEHLDYLQSGLHASNMESMFEGCSNLKTIPKLNIDTSQCTNMCRMFRDCNILTSLDVSNFNTSNVTDMNSMFEHCHLLTSLDVSNFDTSNVINMDSMFAECSSLTSLDVSNFNTSNVTDMGSMFYMFLDYSSLTSLDLSSFDTSNVTDIAWMFRGCANLTTIKGTIDMKSCTDYKWTFRSCNKLKGVKIKNPPKNFDLVTAELKEGQYTIVS